ncbi:MAG: hypothetical protein WBP85_09930 [Terracidiphilus sp.]
MRKSSNTKTIAHQPKVGRTSQLAARPPSASQNAAKNEASIQLQIDSPINPFSQDTAARTRDTQACRIVIEAEVEMKKYLLAAVGIAVSASCHAQNNCPWLNVATASGALGGSSALTITKAGENTEICAFRLQAGSPAESLTVSVAMVPDSQNRELALKAAESQCTSSATPLKAIGNDAVLCAGSQGEQVIGRVRDQIFMISITTEAAPGRGTGNNSMAEKVKAIAEQVAGNLF